MQERRRAPPGTVLAAFQPAFGSEGPVGPPAHVAPALQDEACQCRALADQARQEARGSGKPQNNGNLASIGHGGALNPRAERLPRGPPRTVHALVLVVAHKAPVSYYRTNI